MGELARPPNQGNKVTGEMIINDDFDTQIAIEEWNGAWDADPLDPPTMRAEASAVLDILADALDDNERAILTLVRNFGQLAFKRNDTLNVNRIAAMSGLPQRTVARRVIRIKNCARSMSLSR